jgi:MSHA biogenesis protein MshP
MRSRITIPQRGFSIVSAIFLLVALAALGAVMVTFSTVQHTTSAQDLQGARAYHAARAGIEWGVYQAVRGGGACSGAVPLGGSLATFTVNVVCTNSPVATEGGNSVTIVTITSTATEGAQGTTYYVERQMRVTVERQI